MLLSIANLKHHIAASERGRYTLNAIALTERGTVSTDGKGLLFIPYPKVDAGDVPAIEGVDAASVPPSYPVLISPDDAKRAAAMVPRKHTNPAYRLIHASFGKDKVTLAGTDGATVQKIDVAYAEGQYPDFVSILPDYARSKQISFDISLLLDAIKTVKAASSEDTLTLRFIDREKAANLSTRDGIAALVMPVDEKAIKDGFEVFREKPESQQKARKKSKKVAQPGLVPDAAEAA